MNAAAGAAPLWWGLLFGSIGAGYCVYGRRQRAWLPLLCGVGLIAAPYFIASTVVLVLACAALMALPFVLRS